MARKDKGWWLRRVIASRSSCGGDAPSPGNRRWFAAGVSGKRTPTNPGLLASSELSLVWIRGC
jgi:hypothetical protein